jgi:hypothetical protein
MNMYRSYYKKLIFTEVKIHIAVTRLPDVPAGKIYQT